MSQACKACSLLTVQYCSRRSNVHAKPLTRPRPIPPPHHHHPPPRHLSEQASPAHCTLTLALTAAILADCARTAALAATLALPAALAVASERKYCLASLHVG